MPRRPNRSGPHCAERPQAALPKPFQAVVPEAPVAEVPEAPVIEVANKAPVIKVPEKTDEGTKGSGEGNGLVRNSLQFKPNTILPVGSESGAGAGGTGNRSRESKTPLVDSLVAVVL